MKTKIKFQSRKYESVTRSECKMLFKAIPIDRNPITGVHRVCDNNLTKSCYFYHFRIQNATAIT